MKKVIKVIKGKINLNKHVYDFITMSTKFEILHASPNTIMKILVMCMLAYMLQLKKHMTIRLTLSDTKIDQRSQIVIT